MKKTARRIAGIAMCLMILLGFPMPRAYAADEGYTYTISVYSGKEGYFGNNKNNHVVKFTGIKYGDSFTIDLDELDLHVRDTSHYYARGFKIAGHDNDEVSTRQIRSYTIDKVTGDESFSVAYGIAGGMVKYHVRYEDDYGHDLTEPHEFYGMVGDKPVVSFRYIEGYKPHAYNLGKTLTDNEADNVFIFTYSVAENGHGKHTDGGGHGNAGGGNNGGNGGAAGTTAGTPAEPEDGADDEILDADSDDSESGGVAGYVDLDDPNTPIVGGNGEDDSDRGFSLITGIRNTVLYGGAAAVFLAAMLAVLLRMRRRNTEEYDEA